VFFFLSRRRNTRYIGDWSSDVCSSDLGDLILDGCANIKTLPKGLKVGNNLELIGITLGEDYDDDELRKMIKPGFIKGRINAE